MNSREAKRAKERRYYQRLRNAVLILYHPCCRQCGFDDRRALQVDHIYGEGGKDYRKKGPRGVLIDALRYPRRYQILCANCNTIKGKGRPA